MMLKTIGILSTKTLYFLTYVLLNFLFKIDQDNVCDIQNEEVYRQSNSFIKPVKTIDFMRIKALIIKNARLLSRDYT